MLSTEARIRVIFGDTDQMGVVYHANYLRFFEASRAEFLRARGTTYREMERQGLIIPIVEAHCHYRSPARYEDLLVVKCTVDEVRRASVAFVYEIRREGEEQVLTTGRTVHACINESGRPVRLPAAMVELLGGLAPAPGRTSSNS
jgi:acyl-CoA thioester hydrolase